MTKGEGIDLGHGVYMRWVVWAPDRELNPQYEGIPDDPKSMIVVGHHHPDGEICEGGVTLDTEVNRALAALRQGGRPTWQVESWEPLTLSPSIFMNPDKGGCGLHGFIRDGKWVPA